MYVRTNKGEIFDCIESEQMGKPIYYPKNSKTNGYIDYNEVYKKTNNIIDICEVGDYVNGFIVCDSSWGRVIIAATEDIWEMNSIKDEFRNNDLFVSKVYKLEDIEIKSIVTKEQFEKMKYKIGD